MVDRGDLRAQTRGLFYTSFTISEKLAEKSTMPSSDTIPCKAQGQVKAIPERSHTWSLESLLHFGTKNFDQHFRLYSILDSNPENQLFFLFPDTDTLERG